MPPVVALYHARTLLKRGDTGRHREPRFGAETPANPVLPGMGRYGASRSGKVREI